MSTIKKICCQSGHWNTTNGQTGAPQELQRTLAIGARLVQLLNQNGYQALQCDANADNNPAITGVDWDLFLSLHCDANYAGNEGGGFADFPEPSTDMATNESQRIKKVFDDNYFKDSGIRNVPSRSNPNTRYYYMWSALSAKTPCVILEMGESIDPHDSVILNDTERQANIILNCIKKALPTDSVPLEDIAVLKQKIADLEATEIRLKKEKEDVSKELDKTLKELADANNQCQIKINNYRSKVLEVVKNTTT